jgi:hypothetical protein
MKLRKLQPTRRAEKKRSQVARGFRRNSGFVSLISVCRHLCPTPESALRSDNRATQPTKICDESPFNSLGAKPVAQGWVPSITAKIPTALVPSEAFRRRRRDVLPDHRGVSRVVLRMRK